MGQENQQKPPLSLPLTEMSFLREAACLDTRHYISFWVALRFCQYAHYLNSVFKKQMMDQLRITWCLGRIPRSACEMKHSFFDFYKAQDLARMDWGRASSSVAEQLLAGRWSQVQ